MEKEGFESKSRELIAKFNIDIEKLKEEQTKLAKTLQLKESINLDSIETIAGCDRAYIDNQIISVIVVTDKEMNVIEEKFFMERAKFPYIPGFLAYREMPSMIGCYNKLENSPDILIIEGDGILHPRHCGIASHFGLIIGKPTIGIAKNLLFGTLKDSKIYDGKKAIGMSVETKKGSNPIYVSPGNLISLESSAEIVKKLIKEPHKLPEPLMLAHRYADRIRKEFAEKKV